MASDWSIPEQEESLRLTAEADLPMLALAENVSRLLAEVIQGISVDATEEDPKPNALRIQALWFMAIIAFRALRAAMQALRSGYEDQAVGYQRLVDELHNRAQRLVKDESGEYARQWLEGRGLGKGAKLTGQDFWEFLSGPVHANARAVLDWIAVSHEDGSTQIDVARSADLRWLIPRLFLWPWRAVISPTCWPSSADARTMTSWPLTSRSARYRQPGFPRKARKSPGRAALAALVPPSRLDRSTAWTPVFRATVDLPRSAAWIKVHRDRGGDPSEVEGEPQPA